MYQASNRALTALRPWSQWATAVAINGQDIPPPSAVLHADLARGLGLGGLIATALRRIDDPRADLLTDDRADFSANILRRMQFQEVAGALEVSSIPWTLLKGSAVLEYEPAWRAHRRMTDIDLLVDTARMNDVHHALERLGFHRVDDTGWCSRKWVAASTWHKAGLTLLELDVHSRLHHWPLLVGTEAAVLASRHAPDGLYVPGRPESLMVIALHRARSGYRNAAAELMDAALLARSMSARDWETLVQHGRTHALHVPLAALFGACREWMGIDLFTPSMALWSDLPHPLLQRARQMAEGRWTEADDLSWLVPMTKLYGVFIDPPGAAWTGRMGRASVQRNVSALTALGLHAITRTLDQLPLTRPPRA